MDDPLGLVQNTPGAARPTGPGASGRSSPRPGSGAGEGPAFKDVLMKNIEQVNALQQDAHKAIEDIETGKRDDLANVLIAKQKADTAFKMLQQVRNKLMDAYDGVRQTRL